MRSNQCIHDIFVQAHKNIIDKHLQLCLDIADAMLKRDEATVKDKYVILQDKCRVELEDFGVTPEEQEYIKQHDKEWFGDVIPYIMDKLADQEIIRQHEGE